MEVYLLLALFVFVGVFFGLIYFLRRIGKGKWPAKSKRPVVTVVQPQNTTCLVIGSPNTETTDENGKVIGVNNDGGRFICILHTVDGKVLDESDPDPMNHKLVDEKKADRTERRDLLYRWFSLQFIWLYRYIEISSIRKFRWGRRDEQTEYGMLAKTDHMLFPPFSGQHDIQMLGVETGKVLKFNLRLNFTLEETFPYRVRKRTADSYAQFTIMAMDHVNYMMGLVDPAEFIGGKKEEEAAKNNLKKRLTASFLKRSVREWIEGETGLTIRKASFPEFDYDEETRKLLEAAIKAEKEGKAEVIRARLAKQARIQINLADAHRVEKVIIPAAETPERGANYRADRFAAAHEVNKTLTTLVTGSGGTTPVLPIGGKTL